MLELTGNTLEDLAVDWGKSALAIIGEEMKRRGMNGSIHLGTPRGVYEPIIKRLPVAEQEAGYIKIIRQIVAKATQEAWPSLVFHSVDEAPTAEDKAKL